MRSLKKKFRPRKIKTRKIENETKIFLKTCLSSFESSFVQAYVRILLNEQSAVVVKLTKSDVQNLSPYDTQDSNNPAEEQQQTLNKNQSQQ